MRIGVLAVQGNFREHAAMLRRLGAEAVEVRKPEQLQGVDGLVIPGGESTTFLELLGDDGFEALRRFAAEKPLAGEFSLIAPDGSVAAKSRERHGGPPYFWFAEVASPAVGTWHATLTRDQAPAECSTITREIAVRAAAQPFTKVNCVRRRVARGYATRIKSNLSGKRDKPRLQFCGRNLHHDALARMG